MAELVNLRTARRQAKRRQDEERAHANRLAYGRSKTERELAAAKEAKAKRDLDGHRINEGDG